MIAGCIDTMRRDACGGCERHDACATIFKAFRFAPAEARRAGAARPSETIRPHPFLAFLGQAARAIGQMSAPRPSALRTAVEERIEAQIASGPVRIDRVARDLGYSRQTLYRRLKAEGATFEDLLDRVRRRLALKFVRDEGMPVKEAAYRLGFSDPSAFSRAFKRWTGSSPRGLRG